MYTVLVAMFLASFKCFPNPARVVLSFCLLALAILLIMNLALLNYSCDRLPGHVATPKAATKPAEFGGSNITT